MVWLEWCQRLALHGGDMEVLDMEFELGDDVAFALYHQDDVLFGAV